MMAREEKDLSLRIGKINYANLFPIFYVLERECDCSHYEFIEGVPSTLNRMLRNDEIDVSPSSSIEYLRHEDRYTLINGHSISSKGPVGSIFLVSKKAIEDLGNTTILTTSQSETSVALLAIILKKFYGIDFLFNPTDESLDSALKEADAYLTIGDEAMKAKKTAPSLTLPPRGPACHPSGRGGQGWGGIYIYDLGELWYKNTGLPFSFALWITRKNCYKEKGELFKRFSLDLNTAKARSIETFDRIAKEYKLILLEQHSLVVTEEELIIYWEGISYDFGEEHRRGLELFRKYSEALGLL